jgi:hypothetical protein
MSNKLAKAGVQGGAYMGDPGLFGDIWKGIKSVGRVATGIVGGLGIPVVSGVARTAGGILFGPAPGTTTWPSAPPAGMPPGVQAMPGGIQLYPASQFAPKQGPGQIPYPTPGIAGTMQRWLPGGATGYQAPPPQAAGATMGGYHLNKTGYFLKSGEWIPPLSRWVKNRRRNPGNMRALSRSLGRIKSAKRMTKALSAITIRSPCPSGRSRHRSK